MASFWENVQDTARNSIEGDLDTIAYHRSRIIECESSIRAAKRIIGNAEQMIKLGR